MGAYRSPGRIVAELLTHLEDEARGGTYNVSAETLDDLRVVPLVDERGVSFKVWARGAGGTWPRCRRSHAPDDEQ